MKELENIYRKRKKQLLPLFFGFASCFVLFRIILPQWSDIQDVLQLISTKSETVKAKDANVSLLKLLSDESVDSNYNLVTTALPLEKNIVLIFGELNNAATTTGVKLGGFSVKVGGIYSISSTVQKESLKTIEGIPYLNIFVSASGANNNLQQFAKELYRSVPLVEIKSEDISKNDARYDVNFYYKPVALRPTNVDTTILQDLNSADKIQINSLQSWQSVAQSPQFK